MSFRSVTLPLAFLFAASLSASTAQAQPVFTKAELFAGNPSYEEPKDRAHDGQGILDSPPLAFRTLLFSGNNLVTTVGQEIWYSDLSAAKPVVIRLAGVENRTGQSLRGGSGAQARFANISGLTQLSDGTLVGADQTGNCIFEVKDPFGPGATVSLVAGTTQPQDSVSPGAPPNVGDADGPGAKAKFSLPEWPTAIGDDVYFIDEGKHKVKKMGNDAAHTVTTVATLPDDIYYAMISLNGKLYTVGNNSTSEGFIREIDPATGAARDVVKGRSDTFEGDGAINVSGLATDGKGLFTSQSGRLLYVTLDGNVKSVAGNGTYFEFRQPYDPTKPQKADDVQLISSRRVQTAGSNVFLAYKDKAVYFCGVDTTPYVEKISEK